MKGRKSSSHMGRNIVLTALLAVLCIGGVELAACRHFAPETYDRIVAPARYAASVVVDTGRAALNAAGQFCQATAAKTAELASQAAQAASRQAAALAGWVAETWEDLTTPEEIVLESDPPSEESDLVSIPPATDPPLTELVVENDRQILTGGSVDIVYFCQADEAWAEQPYGTDPIGPYGCGPTAMAMAVASLTGTDTDPAKMAAWAAENGYWARRSGSYHSIVQGTARSFGLNAEAFTSRNPDDLREALQYGGILVALVGPGHFTTGGHFILIRGTSLSGEVLVADPNSLERSLQSWDPQIILDELSSARDNGAPLWLLTLPDT